MRIPRFIGFVVLLGLLSALSLGSQEPAVPTNGLQFGDNASGRASSVKIVQPAEEECEVMIRPGMRPSLIVKGEATGIPKGYKLYLGVHPTHSDSVWSHEVPASGYWLTQAYFGDGLHPPQDGESYQLVAFLTKGPPPVRFDRFSSQPYYASDIVTVKVSVRSWIDRAVAFGKDLGLSLPISALLTSGGAIFGAWIARRTAGDKEISRNREASSTAKDSDARGGSENKEERT